MTQRWDLARLNDQLSYQPMSEPDVDDVLVLEESVYPHPWSSGNFLDSFASAYQAWVLRDQAGQLLAYYLLMPMVDEAHLLNLAVSPDMQGCGLGRFMLDQMLACARGLGMESVLLEVRPSNTRALEVYRRYGFSQIGRRKAYYPAANGQREDAIVMRLGL